MSWIRLIFLVYCLNLCFALPAQDTKREPELQARLLSITARDKLIELYIDSAAVPVAQNDSWSNASQIQVPDYTQMFAFQAVVDTDANCFGALGSVANNYMVTSPKSCVCTDSSYPGYFNLGYDDSKWSKAVVYGYNGQQDNCFNGQVVGGISTNASWIWHDRTGYKDRAYCRCYLPVCDNNPCQHNGVCQPNSDLLCACPPTWTGRYCEEAQTVDLTLTAKERIAEIYIDGNEVGSKPNFGNWQNPDTITIPAESRLVAITANNFGNNCSGILASTGLDTIYTNASWRCDTSNQVNWTRLGFNDKIWSPAVVTGDNTDGIKFCSNQTVYGISLKAQWIWTSHAPNVDQVVYCRGYLSGCDSKPCRNGGTCFKDTELLCGCLPGFYGRYCELVQYFPLTLTANDAIDVLYVDGNAVTLKNNTNYLAVDTVHLTPTTRLIAVYAQCYNSLTGNCRGLLGSVGVQGLTTDNVNWRCTYLPDIGWFTLGYVDSSWNLAYNMGLNTNASRCPTTPQIGGIPSTAMWIWTNPPTVLNSFCRGYIDICANKPCQNGGTCVLNAPAFCRCLAGFTGLFCESRIGIDVQSGIDCNENGYSTVYSDGRHACKCFDGFTGRNCETKLTFCHDVKCLNGGECHDLHNAFQCVCKNQFYGVFCQNSL